MSSDARIQHVNINVDDLASAIVFYRDVIGLPLDSTPDQGFASQFFRINAEQQIHMNQLPDEHGFRGHFCMEIRDFMGVYERAKACGAIDLRPWGRVRRLPGGKMQMFVRDPSGNLIEISSTPDSVIPVSLFTDPLVEPLPGVYRIPPGQPDGAHFPV